jgi:hypothetical protein
MGAQAVQRIDFGRVEAHAFESQIAEFAIEPGLVEDGAAGVAAVALVERVAPFGRSADIDCAIGPARALAAAALYTPADGNNRDRVLRKG